MDLMENGEEAMAAELVVVNRRAVDATWLGDWRDQRCSGPGTSIDSNNSDYEAWHDCVQEKNKSNQACN